MNNIGIMRGLLLLVISIFFGATSTRYSLGDFINFGPGLFPLIASCILFVLGLMQIVFSRFQANENIQINFKNIILILLALCGFAISARFVGVFAALLFLVFFSSIATGALSFWESVKIYLVLMVFALMLVKFLNINLNLY